MNAQSLSNEKSQPQNKRKRFTQEGEFIDLIVLNVFFYISNGQNRIFHAN